jgi:HSP20 family protein
MLDNPSGGIVMIDRYEPFGRSMSLRHVMDRLLEDAFVMPGTGASLGRPSMDLFEENDNLIVEAHLPGMKPDDISVSVENGVLTISGEAKAEEERKERNYLLREKRSGRFTRSLHLPSTYAPDPSDARFEHGELRLVFPKAESAKPRRIQISGSSEQHTSSGAQGGSQNGAKQAVTGAV